MILMHILTHQHHQTSSSHNTSHDRVLILNFLHRALKLEHLSNLYVIKEMSIILDAVVIISDIIYELRPCFMSSFVVDL